MLENVGCAAVDRSRRILVVDDYADGAELTGLMLERAGHTVCVAYGSAQALALAPRFAPQVAVLDLSMPVTDGHELAALLERIPGLGGCKMIALTADDSPSTRQKSAARGFVAHLLKPTDLDQLLDAVVGGEHEPSGLT